LLGRLLLRGVRIVGFFLRLGLVLPSGLGLVWRAGLDLLDLVVARAALEALAVSPLEDPPNVGASPSSVAGTVKLMIFGGSDHKVYLGCLNCSEQADDSVSNKFGTNGSPYSDESIWNQFGDYGSKYSSESACNPYADDPPVIVDQNGKYYGRLSLNVYHPESGVGVKFHDWLANKVCRR